MIGLYNIIFYGIICSIITFGMWRDIDYFKLRKRVKNLERIIGIKK